MTKTEAIEIFNKFWKECRCSYPRELSKAVDWLNNAISGLNLWDYREEPGSGLPEGKKVCRRGNDGFYFADSYVWDDDKVDYIAEGYFLRVYTGQIIIDKHYSDGTCDRFSIGKNGRDLTICIFRTKNPEGREVGYEYRWEINLSRNNKLSSWEIKDSKTDRIISSWYWDSHREEYVRLEYWD